jgi:Calcineurin-like phosphoesterase
VQQLPNLAWVNAAEVGRRGVNVKPMRATQRHVLGWVCVAMLAVLASCRRSDAPTAVNTPASTKTSGTTSAELNTPTNSVLDPFDREVRAYIEQTQPLRQEAAQPAEAVPRQATSPASAEAAVRARQTALAALIRSKARPTAHQGDIFSSASADVFRQRLSAAFTSRDAALIRHELQEQNDERKGDPANLKISATFRAPRVPPEIVKLLPMLPPALEYTFTGRALLLHDVDADLIVDILPNAFPEPPPTSPVPEAESHSPHSTLPLFPVPNLPTGVVFAAIGDSGTGDDAQMEIASLMFRYFTEARRFRFVLMLGDNLYSDDYTGEFALPYKELIDAKVPFYAALGNHDRDLEIHYKPFNMNDADRYQFDVSNARFVALNSNRPNDPAQFAWLDQVFKDAGSKWRIAFFHHPLYSSGDHAQESREVIRPALEPALIRNHVNVVFAGHEHLYERVAPQHGIRYFVSGGGGRKLYDVHLSDFDEFGISEHHFMVLEINNDTLFYESISHTGRILDCGFFWRPEAESQTLDKVGEDWMTACRAAVAWRPATVAITKTR